MSWGIEVEPPEDLDKTHYDVDPSMKIWKSMTGDSEGSQHMKAEVDLDELYHPSVADLLKVQPKNMDDLPNEEVQEEEEPEWDEDKAREVLAKYMAPLMADYQRGAEVPALYSEPEEDMDDVYHKDHPELLPYQHDAAPAAALVDLPSQKKYSEPEEDQDDIYHQ